MPEKLESMARKPKRRSSPKGNNTPANTDLALRIVGGNFRGRKLKYAGDPRVRPMKDRVREALFNLLGPDIKGLFAIDLFGGTGALALEAISRGATGAKVIERHRPTAKVIRENIETLDLADQVELIVADSIRWWRDDPQLTDDPWVVFISPPYRFFTERSEEMLTMISHAIDRAPIGSMIAVEATKEFDFDTLPCPDLWDVRSYPPAVVALLVVTPELRPAAAEGSQSS